MVRPPISLACAVASIACLAACASALAVPGRVVALTAPPSSSPPPAGMYAPSPGILSPVPPSPRPFAPGASVVVVALGMSSDSTVIERPEVEERKKEKSEESSSEKKERRLGSEGWALRLFNDPYNKREFVARCLTEIAGLSDGAAYQVMMHAHQFGMGVVGRYHHERAEMYLQKLKENGLTCDMVPVDDDE